MARLRPYPFRTLVTRMFRELGERDAIFDLPARKFFLGDRDRDLSVRLHGQRASSPLGPAAGPHTQMAQNIVLGWLGGCRIVELKTVQILDQLDIVRPCIDAETIGFNVEWSQELSLEESREEYVKAAMLIEILRRSGELDLVPGYDEVLFDMSVGYDLAGIRSPRVRAFLDGMLDCSELVDRLRREIPAEYARFRDLDFATRLSNSLTLSTFHGCPPDEIERIIEFLLETYGLSCVIKLNPTLLGKDEASGLLHDQLGYRDLRIPDSAFEKDTRWQEAVGFVERLSRRAGELGLGLGVKFSNTLIVENHRDVFPASEKVMYMSGQPLHVLAMNLVRRFRRHFAATIPISFSAGIDRQNFPDAVALGLVPVTVCTDLLRPGGYGRASGYLGHLVERMGNAPVPGSDGGAPETGVDTIAEYCLHAYGHAEAALDDLDLCDAERQPCAAALRLGSDLRAAAGEALYQRWVAAAVLRNTETYVARATADSRYHQERNRKTPRKLGRHLVLFDCITCDKCIPVCPNDANFAFDVPEREFPVIKVEQTPAGFRTRTDGTLSVDRKHQIGNFADFCNECGNCDVFCPEDGGPYRLKPRFFSTRGEWERYPERDGFFLEHRRGDDMEDADGWSDVVWGRFNGEVYRLERDGDRGTYSGEGFELTFDVVDPIATMRGVANIEVDMTYWQIMDWVRDAVYRHSAINYPSLLVDTFDDSMSL